MLKKGARNGQGFDLEKMDEHRRRVYGNVECKTSSQLFPPISKRSHSQFQKLDLSEYNLSKLNSSKQELDSESSRLHLG